MAKGAALGEPNVTINIYKGSSVALLEGSLLLEKSQIELTKPVTTAEPAMEPTSV